MKTKTIGKIVNGKYINCDDSPPPESRMDEVLSSRKMPSIRTDSQFLANHGTLDKQFEGDERQLNTVTETAKKHGYSPSPNDTYIPTLARFPGDPLAFVPAGSPKNHIKKVCEATDRACEGDVSVERSKKSPAKTVRLGEDLVQEEAAHRIAMNPEEALKSKKQLRNEILDKHGAKPYDKQ
tara:strand:+ start:422 stop:964 length:543 start_codon:yes stop_codon:yes gene_type:complete